MNQDETNKSARALAELARLLDLTNDAIIIRNVNNHIIYWNRGATELYGWTSDEVLGLDLHTLLRTEFELPLNELMRKLNEKDRMEGEVVQLTRSGRRMTLFCRWALDRDSAGRPGAILTTYNDITQRKKLEARIQKHTAELLQLSTIRQELLQRIITVQEDERQRIARELHDSLGQFFAALIIRLTTLENTPNIPLKIQNSLYSLRALTTQIDAEIDRLTMELRPPTLDDLGLVDALRSYCQEWTTTSGIPVDIVSINAEPTGLALATQATAYRIVQEALTNVLRHAQATQISVIVERRPEMVRMIIEDNGQGFDATAFDRQRRPGRQLGLIGMVERAMLVGGTLTIESEPGSGTTVFLHIPLQYNDTPHLNAAK